MVTLLINFWDLYEAESEDRGCEDWRCGWNKHDRYPDMYPFLGAMDGCFTESRHPPNKIPTFHYSVEEQGREAEAQGRGR